MRSNALRYDAQAGRLIWVDVVTGETVAGEPPSEVPDLSTPAPVVDTPAELAAIDALSRSERKAFDDAVDGEPEGMAAWADAVREADAAGG